MKRLLPFIILILLLIGVFCLPFLLPLDRYRAQIAENLSQRLQHPVLISRLELVLFPPTLRLRDVNVLAPSNNTALVRVDQILAPLNLPALFKARVVPQSLQLTGWTVTVQRKPDGHWAWDDWLMPAAHLGGTANWPLQTITFDRGECQLVDAYSPSPERFVIQVLQGAWKRDRQNVAINGVLTNLPVPVSFLFQASGTFLSNPQWTGVLGLTEGDRQWKLECKALGDRIQASLRSDAWRYDTAFALIRFFARLPVAPPATSASTLVQGWEGQVDQQGNTLTVSHRGTLAGGHAEGNGTIVWGSPVPTASAQIAVEGVKVEQLESALWGNAPLEGMATGIVKWNLTLSTAGWSGVNGQGALEIKDGRYYVPASSIQKLAKAHTLRYLKKKVPDFQSQGVPYKKAGLHWQMRHGVATFDDVFCDMGDIKVGLVGSYDAARSGLDAYTRVQIQERNPQLLKELPPSYIHEGEGRPQIQPMHGRVQGSPAEWQLRAVRGSKVPPAVANKLSRAIRNK